MGQDWLAKVRNMLDAAEATERTADRYAKQGNTEKEQENRAAAANWRTKAEELMVKFRIDQENLLARDATAAVPVKVGIDLCSYNSEYQQAYVNLFYAVAVHTGCRVAYGVKSYRVTAYAVGYSEDIEYTEMLFTAARLVFAERLEPQVQQHLSDQENVYRLRSAGIERVRISEMLWGNRDKANLSKVGRLYKAECAKRGEQAALSGRGVTGKTYREQYAQEFPWALQTRLQRARDAAGRMGGGLELHGRRERVEEAFYKEFPELRPKPAVEASTPSTCGSCKTTKHPSGLCKDHRPRQETAADRARRARYYSPAAQAGRAAGTAAASHVQLDRAGREAVEDGGRGDVERVAFELEG